MHNSIKSLKELVPVRGEDHVVTDISALDRGEEVTVSFVFRHTTPKYDNCVRFRAECRFQGYYFGHLGEGDPALIRRDHNSLFLYVLEPGISLGESLSQEKAREEDAILAVAVA
jgi:hypothetical protein